jgi:hypothetical protein
MRDEKRSSSTLYQLATELQAAEKRAEQLVMFIDSRDLIVCPCGLTEDVDIRSYLSTYFRPPEFDQAELPVDFKPPPDTGLRFEPLSEDEFRCPLCGTVIRLESELAVKD